MIVATVALEIGAFFATLIRMPTVWASVSSILATLPISTPCNSTGESAISLEIGLWVSI